MQKEAEPKSEPAVFDEAASDAAANPDDLGESEDTEEDGEEEGDTPAEPVEHAGTFSCGRLLPPFLPT